MHKICKYLFLTAIICLLGSCQQARQLFSKSEEQVGVVGGYSESHNLSDEELAIFQQATSNLQGVEYKPMNVATQIVAGVNYRFLCKARRVEQGGKKGKRYYATIVVHKPLAGRGDLKILSIEKQSR